jgi:hypothetical protein
MPITEKMNFAKEKEFIHKGAKCVEMEGKSQIFLPDNKVWGIYGMRRQGGLRQGKVK